MKRVTVAMSLGLLLAGLVTAQQPVTPQTPSVVWVITGETVYHRPYCEKVRGREFQILRIDELDPKKVTPCPVCRPDRAPEPSSGDIWDQARAAVAEPIPPGATDEEVKRYLAALTAACRSVREGRPPAALQPPPERLSDQQRMMVIAGLRELVATLETRITATASAPTRGTDWAQVIADTLKAAADGYQRGYRSGVVPNSVAGPYLGVSGSHWIESVTDDGSLLTLEDDSIWAIYSVDQVRTWIWLPSQRITVVAGNGIGEYTYLLVNGDGQTARAKYLGTR